MGDVFAGLRAPASTPGTIASTPGYRTPFALLGSVFQSFAAPGGAPLGSSSRGFYPAEDLYAPGDSMAVRPTSPDSIPYFTDRRAVGRAKPTIPLLGLAGLVGLMILLEHYRPK